MRGALRTMRTSRRDVAPQTLAKLRAICGALPGAVEQIAWVGVRWQVRKRTFAHVLVIDDGWPPAYARAAGSDGPLTVLTFRSAGPLCDALCASGAPFFRAQWGVTWGTKVVGMRLEGRVAWKKVAALLAGSHALLAPKALPSAPSASRRAASRRAASRRAASRRAASPGRRRAARPRSRPR